MQSEISSRTEAVSESTFALQRTIADLTDAQARGASLLPGWSRGHVLTHIARNADALVNLATWAATGVETPMYASREERDATIETQSSRPAAELIADIEASHQRFLSSLDEIPASAWSRQIHWGARRRDGQATVIPQLRRVEVEIHHVDLDLDYTLAHWPEDFAEDLIAETVADFTARGDAPGLVLVATDDEGQWVLGGGGPEVSGPPRALLAWLIGRSNGLGLHSDGPLPTLGTWR